MELFKDICKFQGLTVLATPEYLNSLNGVADFGYLVDAMFVLPFVVRKKMMFRWIQLDSDVIIMSGKADAESIQQFYDDAVEYGIPYSASLAHI